jgi:hypothetical protein
MYESCVWVNHTEIRCRALLWAMKEYHEHHEPEAPRYERAIRHLVREGALVWEERVGTVPGSTSTGSPDAASSCSRKLSATLQLA